TCLAIAESFSQTATIWQVDTEGRATTVGGTLDGVSWAPDRAHAVLTVRGPSRMHIYDAETDRTKPLTTPIPTRMPAMPAWSPRGDVVASSDCTVIDIWDPATGACRARFDAGNDVRRLAWSPDGSQLATASHDFFDPQT